VTNARDRLNAARQAAREGRHEEALRELLWFHHHALEENRALAGVRLSYALYYWLDLGKAYPPAQQALLDLREQKAQTLLRGEGDRSLFHDLSAIDDRLGQARATYDVYLALAERFPALAAECAKLALPAIVAAKDYLLADRIRSDPEARIRTSARMLRHDIQYIKHRRFTRAPQRWASIKGYTESARRDAEITAGIGQQAEARRLLALAIDLIHDPSLRADVRAGMAKSLASPGMGKHRARRAMALRREMARAGRARRSGHDALA
jgi:hypothetical protein